ncbi:MAG TPA: SMP-30/gluconolactonase/LRE family protein [Solirubrobacteraceae bacterium]|nr:SMP-30/gluconolactonase/LRE family protein [Solirubrobacteraceae bacterium]
MIPRACAVAFLAASFLLSLSSSAPASRHVDTIVEFDAFASQLPEGLAIDGSGDLFVSFAPLGQLAEIDVDEGEPAEVEPVGSVPGVNPATDIGLLGLAVRGGGDVYGAVVSAAAQGVWRFDDDHGPPERLPGTQAIGFPNGLAFDPDNNLYVTSSSEGTSATGAFLGGIWRISRDGSVERLLVDQALGGTGRLIPSGVGANGIAYRDGALYVTNTENGRLLRIAVRRDGSLGTPTTIASGAELVGADGLALDVHGNAYVAVISQSTIVRVTPGGDIRLVADASDGLDWTSSVAFGRAPGTEDVLYAVNFAIGTQFGNPPEAGPALLAIDVGVRGR